MLKDNGEAREDGQSVWVLRDIAKTVTVLLLGRVVDPL